MIPSSDRYREAGPCHGAGGHRVASFRRMPISDSIPRVGHAVVPLRAAGRRLSRLLATVGLTAAALLAAPGLAQAARPNIVVIQTDDQNAGTVRSTFRKASGSNARIMPNTVKEIFRGGTEFRNYYATTPLCSPSRASSLTGQYSQNHGLTENDPPIGGWAGWQNIYAYNDNLSVALQGAGYRTSHFGKFTNQYYDIDANQVETTVPLGWDNWFTTSFTRGAQLDGFEVSDNGVARRGFGNPLRIPDGPRPEAL